MSEDEVAAVTAHWLLGRLSVLQATTSYLATAEDLSPEDRRHLAGRAQAVAEEMRESLEAMARGFNSSLIDLSDDKVVVSPQE